VGFLCHQQGYGFPIADVENMTIEAVGQWIRQAEIICAEIKGEDPPDDDEEKARRLKAIEEARKTHKIKVPRIVNGDGHKNW